MRVGDVAGLADIAGLQILAVDVPTWLASINLAWHHKDLADRVIVATATQFGCPLVSSDRVIAAYYEKTVW